ncbi:ferric reductase like transmembrane component-domain-containing protein [Clohesyomyces aquaticus]|uniref:Ferric reductase like transmembrane component-domain-containing protein n=1 Tax=Clohesyomyces aquaticus TaxID=1231657 RepID=A0A1Y1ZPN5_9PLEO|nr:ferric reductase like transmembrane component-domain-containing protein [Clohesyomyces aquaticus]
MLYTFIIWAVIGGILLLFILARLFRPNRNTTQSPNGGSIKQGFFYRIWRTISSGKRRYLLSESLPRVFPNTTRLQVLILACLCVYLTIFSFVGIRYRTWITPVKGTNKFNTRTGLGGFSDRIGALAYALTPLTIALSTRDSILSLLTGVPYQHFNFLHRWTGRIILVQSFVHTIGWTIIEGKLYQPQPKVYNNFIKQPYMIWGIVAQGFIAFLWVFSTSRVIRWTGYEFFRKSHFVVAGLYLGACWGHWNKLACWMIASLGLLGVDLGLRIVRVCLIHLGYKSGNKGLGFRAIQSRIETFKDPSGTILRMEFTHNHEPWKVGQHYYLTFPSLSIWQSHPFTVASTPPTRTVSPKHTYIIRARNGETGKLAALAEATAEIPVILVGPYGGSVVDNEVSNILAIAGGTGISFTLPIFAAALANPSSYTENLELVWIVRHVENLTWIAPELLALRAQLEPRSPAVSDTNSDDEIKECGNVAVRSMQSNKCLRIRIFVTRSSQTTAPKTITQEKDLETSSASSSASASTPTHSHDLRELLKPHPSFSITYLDSKHPSIPAVVDAFIGGTVSSGRTQVVASGPTELGTDIRAAVAARNSAGGVWSGDEKGDVDCVWDDRMG